jgi:hypothetical protein
MDDLRRGFLQNRFTGHGAGDDPGSSLYLTHLVYALIRYESWLSGIWAANGITWKKSFAVSIEDGTALVDGNVDILVQLAATWATFEIGFEIMPGTRDWPVK